MVVRRPAEKSQSGRYGAEPTPVCSSCHVYMTRQFIKKGSTTCPTSWICEVCGHMHLDEKKFALVKEVIEE